MRNRITVADAGTGLRSDVVLECAPDDAVGDVLAPLVGSLHLAGAPTVDGAPLDLAAPIGCSALCDGAVLHFGAAPAAPAAEPDGYAIRVVSGPTAGARVPLHTDVPLDLGRSSGVGLVLDDPDVSRLHATITATRDGVWLTDRGSSNGVFVDGQALIGPHALREGEVVQLGGSRLVLESIRRARAVLERAQDGAFLLNRRFPDRRSPFVAPAVQLPAATPEDDARSLPVLAMVLPAALSILLAFVLASPIYLLFGLMSPVMLAGNWWTERKRRAAREKRQDGSYADKLRAAVATVERSVADEDADLRERRPDPATVARIALEPRVELWSRRPGEDGWLDLRLGTADRPATVMITGERPAGWVDPVLRHAPVGVDLDAVGVLGLAGPPPWLADRLAWVLTQCAVLHSPDELQIVVLAPDADEDDLGRLRWLPHARDAAGTILAGWDDEGVAELLRSLGTELDRRAEMLRVHRTVDVRQVLVVLTGAGALSRQAAVGDLLTRGPALGMRMICTDVDDRLLPDRCRAVLVGTELRVDRGARTALVLDTLPGDTADRIARRLAPMRRIGDAPEAGLPDTVRFTDGTPVPDPDAVRAAWRLTPERTDVVVGRDSDGSALLDIDRDGPHAVVAGTTGAGKSELLQTWMAALALANAPTRLSMVFVDYKGGSSFKDLVALPHVVGSVTNLDERLAARALASLHAELRRRQEQLAAAGAGDRSDYLRRAAADPGLPQFPRLLIVVDELAELKEQLPAMVDGLVGVARVGRSLGVHLVLATQKPAGVVDGQIRANADLRICLRTANASESMDVIESGAAADIPKERPGRALVVRGGSPARLVQTARITTPQDTGDAVTRRAVPLRWDDVAAPPPPRSATDGLRTDLTALVDAVSAAAREECLAAPYRPWTPPLPEIITLDRLPAVALAIPLGLRDRPTQQRQEPLQVPLGSGHLAVIGSGRTGRTGALRAIAAGLACGAGPDAVQVHAVDASGGLAGLVALPHVGVVVGDDDPERLERLLTRLVELVRDRKRRMAEHGASTVAELPYAVAQVVLLVDGWSGTSEGTDAGAPAALQDLLGGGSAAAGVTVCLAGDERLLKARVLGRLDHRLALRLNTPSDATLLGLDIRNLPAGLLPGRGLWAADGSEVQIPLLTADPAGPAQAAALATLGRTLQERYGPAADTLLRLDPLPVRIGLDAATGSGHVPPGSMVLGVSGDRLAPVWVALDDLGGHVVVAGPARSGRSTAVAALAASAFAGGARTVLVTARPGPSHRAAEARGVALLAPGDPVPEDVEVVAIDDADALVWDDALVARLTGPHGPHLVVGALLDSFGFGARGLVHAARKAIGPVVLLSPPNHMSADGVGVKIDRSASFTGPPGRAFLSMRGEVVLGQVAEA